MPRSGPIELLAALARQEVDYILVGGMAAVVRGAPIATLDIDIVHERADENVGRLLSVLAGVGARYRGQPKGRVLRPTAGGLRGAGRHNLMTSLGALDLLGEIDAGLDHAALLPMSDPVEAGGFCVRVLRLDALVEIKSRSSRDKDRIMLPVLLATLAKTVVGSD